MEDSTEAEGRSYIEDYAQEMYEMGVEVCSYETKETGDSSDPRLSSWRDDVSWDEAYVFEIVSLDDGSTEKLVWIPDLHGSDEEQTRAAWADQVHRRVSDLAVEASIEPASDNV